jgi:hypothetical protein
MVTLSNQHSSKVHSSDKNVDCHPTEEIIYYLEKYEKTRFSTYSLLDFDFPVAGNSHKYSMDTKIYKEDIIWTAQEISG